MITLKLIAAFRNSAVYLTACIALPMLASCALDPVVTEPFCPWSQDASRWNPTEPSWTKALIAHKFEQKNASDFVTGGKIIREYAYDSEGHVMQIVSNGFGMQGVIDQTARCALTPKAFSDRKVGVYSFQDLVRLGKISITSPK